MSEFLAQIIRQFEIEVQSQFQAGVIKGTVHLCIGQELSDVEIIKYYEDPLVFGNHRSHGQYIAATKDIKGCYKQILDFKSQHLYYPDKFISNGIQGALCPVAVGNALGLKIKGSERRVLCFIGDGTLGQGVFWESLNFASIHDLSISFVVVDNGYSMSKTKSMIDVRGIARAFNVAYREYPDMKKDGAGSCEIVYVKVSRLCGHSCNDTQTYRDKDEILNDQITTKYESEAKQVIQDIIGR